MTSSIENPLKSARKAIGLSVDALSKELFLDKTPIIRSESGTYPRPPQALLDFHNITLEQYRDYQSLKRHLSASEYKNYPDLSATYQSHPSYPTPLPNPLVDWIKNYNDKSSYQFCEDFCINQPTVYRFIATPYKYRDFPTSINRTLKTVSDMEYTVDNLIRSTRVFLLRRHSLNLNPNLNPNLTSLM